MPELIVIYLVKCRQKMGHSKRSRVGRYPEEEWINEWMHRSNALPIMLNNSIRRLGGTRSPR